MNRLMMTAATLALFVPAGVALMPAQSWAAPIQLIAQPADKDSGTMSEAWRSLKAGAYDAWQRTSNAFDEMTRKSQQDVVVLGVALPGALSGKQLIGTPIESAKEGRVGSIADLVLGADNQIDAIVVSDGGFLGIGNAQTPVKPGLISISKEKNGTLHARTNVTEAQLDNAANGAFMTRIEAMRDDFKDPKVKTVSRIIGATVVGPDNKAVATVNDLLLSPVGEARYALLSVGGVMGLNAKQVAVKASSLTFTSSILPLKTAMTAAQLYALSPVGSATTSAAAN